METQIKICGLQSVEVLKSIKGYSINLIGVVLAPSRRQVSEAVALDILSEARPKFSCVGVLVNPSKEEVTRLLKILPLTHLQFHGEESPTFCKAVREVREVHIIKALPVRNPEGGLAKPKEELLSFLCREINRYRPFVDGFLFDTSAPAKGGSSQVKSTFGGSGQSFSWELIPSLKEQLGETPYWIAGGLRPDNVGLLIEQYHPYGVDVSSGVESNDRKDPQKVRDFVEKVRSYEQLHHAG